MKPMSQNQTIFAGGLDCLIASCRPSHLLILRLVKHFPKRDVVGAS